MILRHHDGDGRSTLVVFFLVCVCLPFGTTVTKENENVAPVTQGFFVKLFFFVGGLFPGNRIETRFGWS